MWLLKNENKGQVYKIKPNVENIVSRKDGDLLLADDQSISRRHAVLKFNVNGDNIILKDLGSKYGTSVKCGETDFKKAVANEEIELNNGNVIRFGIQGNCWTLEYFPITVTASTLGREEKIEIREIISKLNGSVVSDWTSQCTHLVMDKLTVTVKVVCALANCRSITTTQYWRKLYQCIHLMQLPLPDVNDFIPELVEATLNPNDVSFIPNPMRKTLFSGTIFVASTPRQLSRIERIVTAAGGKVEEFLSSKTDVNNYLCGKYILMMHSALDNQSSQESQIPNGYKAITKILKGRGVRCIPEPDIGLSILYCSMDKHCNPRFKFQILPQSNNSSKLKEPSELVPNTEDQSRSSACENMVVPETSSMLFSNFDIKSKKRTCEPEEISSVEKRLCREDAFSPQPGSSRQILEPQTIISSPDMFLPSGQNVVDSSTKSDPFHFPIHSTRSDSSSDSKYSKKANSSINIFSSIVEKNKSKKDEDFTFPCEVRKNNNKLEGNKRSRDEDSEFDFPQKWEDKRPKLNTIVCNSNKNETNNTCNDNSDPFSFSEKKVPPSKILRKNKNNKGTLWDFISEGTKSNSEISETLEQERPTDIFSESNSSSPEFNKESNIPTRFQICFDEEIKKEALKPIPVSSFIAKPVIKKEVTTEEEEELANEFSDTMEIQVKSLVKVITASMQELPLQKVQKNVANFKKFKRNIVE